MTEEDFATRCLAQYNDYICKHCNNSDYTKDGIICTNETVLNISEDFTCGVWKEKEKHCMSCIYGETSKSEFKDGERKPLTRYCNFHNKLLEGKEVNIAETCNDFKKREEDK